MTGAAKAAAFLALLGCGCEEDCPIPNGIALQVTVRAEADLPVAQGSYAYEFDGRMFGPIGCTYDGLDAPPPGVVSCASLTLLVDSANAGVLDLEFTAPGFRPYSGEFEVQSDGCDVIAQTAPIELQWLAGDELCQPYCSNVVGCETDTPFATVDECVVACAADIADPVPDPCVPLYRGLYACLGSVSCEEYLESRENLSGGACGAHIAAISDCEESL